MGQTAMRWWRAFRAWRRSRPFWAGVFGLLAAMVLSMPVATIKVGALALTLQSLGGMSAALISVVLMCCAIGVWWRPDLRVPCGVVTMVAALVSLPNVNMGGFFLGLACGLISGALALSWSPGSAASEDPDGQAADRVRSAVADERTTGRGAPDEQTVVQPAMGVLPAGAASTEPVPTGSFVDSDRELMDAATPVMDGGSVPEESCVDSGRMWLGDADAPDADRVPVPHDVSIVGDEATLDGVEQPARDEAPDVEQTLPQPAIVDAPAGEPVEPEQPDAALPAPPPAHEIARRPEPTPVSRREVARPAEPTPQPIPAAPEPPRRREPHPAAARLRSLTRGSRPYATPAATAAVPERPPANQHPRPALSVVPPDGPPPVDRPRGPIVPPVHPSQIQPLHEVGSPRQQPAPGTHNRHRPPAPFVPPPPQLAAMTPAPNRPEAPRHAPRKLGSPPAFVPPPAALVDGQLR